MRAGLPLACSTYLLLKQRYRMCRSPQKHHCRMRHSSRDARRLSMTDAGYEGGHRRETVRNLREGFAIFSQHPSHCVDFASAPQFIPHHFKKTMPVLVASSTQRNGQRHCWFFSRWKVMNRSLERGIFACVCNFCTSTLHECTLPCSSLAAKNNKEIRKRPFLFRCFHRQQTNSHIKVEAFLNFRRFVFSILNSSVQACLAAVPTACIQ